MGKELLLTKWLMNVMNCRNYSGDHKDYNSGHADHPEWILLCDDCEDGWHASCLRPSLMVIPEGDW